MSAPPVMHMPPRKNAPVPQPEKPKRRYTTIKFDAEIAYQLRIIVEWRSKQQGKTVTSSDYLSDFVAADIRREYNETVEAMSRDKSGR